MSGYPCNLWFLLAIPLLPCCSQTNSIDLQAKNLMAQDHSNIIYVTSEAGEKFGEKEGVKFTEGRAQGKVIFVNPDNRRQKVLGIGTSMTESSAFVLAHLTKEKRAEVVAEIFGQSGAAFSLSRVHIGSCDFCVEGKYCYADKPEDKALAGFSVATDKIGFDAAKYPGVKANDYDLLPLIKEAIAENPELKIISSAWTAPPWMKSINAYYENGYVDPSEPDGWHHGSGGWLNEYQAYADYLYKYLHAYENEGVSIWGMTLVNEPLGNDGNWESMQWDANGQRDFVKKHLGPMLHANDFADVKLMFFDHNREALQPWADTVLGDPDAAKYLYGAAVHWYASTYKVYSDALDQVHNKYPGFAIINTEACIDDLGNTPNPNCEDPKRAQETNWFQNDDFWWNKNATDWGYRVPWADAADHPIYTPVHRYARDIIQGFNHWMTGWVDWNIVLDKHGGPNHVGNNAGAPIMIDSEASNPDAAIYYTPVFHILQQLSRTIGPESQVVESIVTSTNGEAPLREDAIHALATVGNDNSLAVNILNTQKAPQKVNLQIGNHYAEVELSANSLTTIDIDDLTFLLR